MTPVITIPRVARPGDESGLRAKKYPYNAEGVLYHAVRYEDGVPRLTSLKTGHLALAKRRRNALYKELQAAGATEVKRGRPKANA